MRFDVQTLLLAVLLASLVQKATRAYRTPLGNRRTGPAAQRGAAAGADAVNEDGDGHPGNDGDATDHAGGAKAAQLSADDSDGSEPASATNTQPETNHHAEHKRAATTAQATTRAPAPPQTLRQGEPGDSSKPKKCDDDDAAPRPDGPSVVPAPAPVGAAVRQAASAEAGVASREERQPTVQPVKGDDRDDRDERNPDQPLP